MATNFLRTLSQRLTKSKNRSQHQQPRSSSIPRNKETSVRHSHCQCRVQLLDNSDLNILIGVFFYLFLRTTFADKTQFLFF